MKTIDDALELRGRIFGAFEMAESEEDPEARAAWMRFVAVGGGPTGVEIAGQIAELSRHGLKHNFRRIDPADAEVLLFDGGKEILANFGDQLSQNATKELARLGVAVRTERIVTGVDAFGVDVRAPDGSVERVAARTKICARSASIAMCSMAAARTFGSSSSIASNTESAAASPERASASAASFLPSASKWGRAWPSASTARLPCPIRWPITSDQ
jgi:NADH dehydrogenase